MYRSSLAVGFLIFVSVVNAQKSLFNRHDLTGWEIYGTQKWYVDNGLLVAESGPNEAYGYLAIKKNYKNFELELEFLQEANGNSGIFFRSSLEGTKISGWQVEVVPPNLYTGGVYESYGRGWMVKPKSRREENLKFGEWNHLKIKEKDGEVATCLNGRKMINFSD